MIGMYTRNMRTTQTHEQRLAAWQVKQDAWEAHRARSWERLEGIPQDKPVNAAIHIGASIFAPIIWNMRVILTANKNGQPVLKPVNAAGKPTRCVLPNGQGKRQFGACQLVEWDEETNASKEFTAADDALLAELGA